MGEPRPLITEPAATLARNLPPGVQPEADARCVAAVLAGGREHFGELITRYQDAVISIVRGYVQDAHAAEDVAQDTFLNAYTALPQLRDPKLFFPWLMQIARHRAAQAAQRGEQRREQQPLSGEEAAGARPDPTRERATTVLGYVEQLPDPYRETVMLKYERKLSCKQIAALQGVAVGTVTSRLTRALIMLRNCMQHSGEE